MSIRKMATIVAFASLIASPAGALASTEATQRDEAIPHAEETEGRGVSAPEEEKRKESPQGVPHRQGRKVARAQGHGELAPLTSEQRRTAADWQELDQLRQRLP